MLPISQISWTHALRKIVINCYKFHGREDLLPAFSEEDEKANQLATLNSSVATTHVSTTALCHASTLYSSIKHTAKCVTFASLNIYTIHTVLLAFLIISKLD